MIVSAICLLVVQAGRTAPFDVPTLRDLQFKPTKVGVQIGRAQVVVWEARTTQSVEELQAKLPSWASVRGDRSRVVNGVRQKISVGLGRDGDREYRVVWIREEPPERTVPADWPTGFRGGLMRIVPDEFAFLRGIEPHRWETDASPSGNLASAIYRVRVPMATVEREVLGKFPGWKRVEGRDGIRLTSSASGDRSFLGRGIESVRVIPEGENLLVSVRWYYSSGDRAGAPRLKAETPTYRGKPISRTAREVLGEVEQARQQPMGSFGGHTLHWSLSRKGSLDEIAAVGKKLGLRVSQASGIPRQPSRVNFRTDGVEVEATEGRQAIRTAVPVGYRATPDFAGFWETVVVDRGTYVTISVTERRTSPTAPWPKELTYAWPPAGVGKLPLAEMNRQPDHVQFPGRLAAGSPLAGLKTPMSARWRIKPSPQRSKELSTYRYAATPTSQFEYLTVSAGGEGWMVIHAQFR